MQCSAEQLLHNTLEQTDPCIVFVYLFVKSECASEAKHTGGLKAII